MLNIVYFSNVSEYTHRFIQRFNDNNPHPVQTIRLPLTGDQPEIEGDFILICPSYGTERNQHVPPQVKKFLSNPVNRANCAGVVGSGNKTFGSHYAKAGQVLAAKLDVTLLFTFELSGLGDDVESMRTISTWTRASIEEAKASGSRPVSVFDGQHLKATAE